MSVSDRDEREDNLGDLSKWDLVERVIDLEDRINELDLSRLESALRMYVAELDYDIHKGIQCGEEDGRDHYPEEVSFFLRCWETAGEN